MSLADLSCNTSTWQPPSSKSVVWYRVLAVLHIFCGKIVGFVEKLWVLCIFYILLELLEFGGFPTFLSNSPPGECRACHADQGILLSSAVIPQADAGYAWWAGNARFINLSGAIPLDVQLSLGALSLFWAGTMTLFEVAHLDTLLGS